MSSGYSKVKPMNRLISSRRRTVGAMSHRRVKGVYVAREGEGVCGEDKTKGSPMWLLLIILLTPLPGIDGVTVLNTFATYEECQPERDRIGFEMAESYPHENNFRIVCEFRERRPSKGLLRHIPHERPLHQWIFDRLAADSPLPILQ